MNAEATEAVILAEYRKIRKAGAHTKRSSVRIALANAISSGALAPGSEVPPEQHLTRLLGVSLGTVQAAMRQLAERGVITRRRGDGTRVNTRKTLPDSVWHLRFVNPETCEPLSIETEKLWRDEITEPGPWTDAFPGGGRMMLRRKLDYSNGARVAQEIYLSPPALDIVDTIGTSELEFTNIRPVLLRRLVPEGEISRLHRFTLRPPSPKTAAIHELPDVGDYGEILATVSIHGDRVFYFQRIYFPTRFCALEF